MRNDDPDQRVWVDLGCGTSKQPGFVGIDRFALPGVDIVCDLERGIPLRSDSVDHVLASHALEHLRDLPAVISEIYRVCKDRAVVTIIAPYDATRLNHANPYHVQTWNEHTARFFTVEGAPGIAPEDYSFPAAEHWGLQASDFTRSDVDMRCLRMEFTYLPPYRGLTEEEQRTLRHALSDVSDQMALRLLVVKSPLTQEEFAREAATIQLPTTPAFEQRLREESDTSAQNLFSTLARVPSRLDQMSAETNNEIAQLGDEMRRFIARVGQIEAALVAETGTTKDALGELKSAGRVLSERMTAINSALTRRVQSIAEQTEGFAALGATYRGGYEQIMSHLVAERAARTERGPFPIRYLRRYRQRGRDLRSAIGGAFTRLYEGPEAAQSNGFKLQASAFLQPGAAHVFELTAHGKALSGIDLGVVALFPPAEAVPFCNFELRDGHNELLRRGVVTIDQTSRAGPTTITFDPAACEPGQALRLALAPLDVVGRIGVQLLEWHRVMRILRRVPERKLAWRGRYEP